MDRRMARALRIVVWLLACALAPWPALGAQPAVPFELALLPADVPDQSYQFVRSPQAQTLFHAVPGASILVRGRQARWWRLTALRDIDPGGSPQLVMSHPFLKRLEVWRPGDSLGVRRSLYGPDSDLSHSALSHVVPLPQGLRAGESVYLRIRSSSNVVSTLSIEPLAAVYARDGAYNRMRTFFLTALGVVALLSIGFSISLRQRGYSYLAATLLTQVITLAIEGGDFRANPWLSAIATDRRTAILLNTAAVLASVRFLRFFLDLPATQPRVTRVLDACSAVLGTLLVVSVFHIWPWTSFFGNGVLLIVIATIVLACVRAIGERRPEAFILLAAWAPLMAVLVVRIGGQAKWWPNYEWLRSAYPWAVTFGGLALLWGFTHQHGAILRSAVRQLSRDRDSARQRAAYDGLTGVLARPAFEDALATAVAGAHASGRPLCAAFIDVDRFKLVNDAYGHAIGDEVLRIVAKRVGNRLRADDCVGRYGGDEMVLLLPNTALVEALRLADQLRQAIVASPFAIDGALIDIDLSLGVAQLRAGEPAVELLKRADSALYASKRNGRGRVSGDEEWTQVAS